MDSRLLTPEEVAQRLRISRITVMEHLRSGALKGIKVGRLWRISEDALSDFCGFPKRVIPHVSHEPGGMPAVQAFEVCRETVREASSKAEGPRQDDVDRRWLDSYWDGCDRPLEEYDWGPGGVPAVRPVRYVPGKGLMIEGATGDEPE